MEMRHTTEFLETLLVKRLFSTNDMTQQLFIKNVFLMCKEMCLEVGKLIAILT